MQPQECFVSSACYSFWAHRLGTLLGTHGAFFARSVQKTEGKRDKATVFRTIHLERKIPIGHVRRPARHDDWGTVIRRASSIARMTVLAAMSRPRSSRRSCRGPRTHPSLRAGGARDCGARSSAHLLDSRRRSGDLVLEYIEGATLDGPLAPVIGFVRSKSARLNRVDRALMASHDDWHIRFSLPDCRKARRRRHGPGVSSRGHDARSLRRNQAARSGCGADPQRVERFEREARAAAALNPPTSASSTRSVGTRAIPYCHGIAGGSNAQGVDR